MDENRANSEINEPVEIKVPMPWGVVAVKSWNNSCMDKMLVLHGANQNAGGFDLLIPLLTPIYNYVCIDLPGHGLSTAFTPGLPLSFMHFIAAIQRTIYHFGWQNFSILAHSFGAHLGLVLAASECDKVDKLILIDGTARIALPDEMYLTRCSAELQELLQAERNYDEQPHALTYEQALEKRMSGVFPVSKKAAQCILARSTVKINNMCYKTTDFRSCFKTMPHMSKKVHLYNCKLIRCPVLLIFPENSKMHEIHSSNFHQAIIKTLLASHSLSRIERIEGDHNCHCNYPKQVAKVLNCFFDDTKQLSAQKHTRAKI